MIPALVDSSVTSQAERRLFNVIKEASGTESWVCLHSLGLARHQTKRRGEIDFVIICRKGIFVLEVKGGGVSRTNGIWQTIDRYGEVKKLKESPFDQAAKAMFSLQQDLVKHFGEDSYWKTILFGYGVMFPDVIFHNTGTEIDSHQIYDANDRDKPFVQYIDRLANFARNSTPYACFVPTEKEINNLVDFLRPDFDLISPLIVKANNVLEEMISLEKEQYFVLDAVGSSPRLIVQGGAGTGKTLLAFEIARREAKIKENTILLICFNRLLARFFEAKVKSEGLNEKITVKSIHTLINELIEASSFADEFKIKRKESDTKTLFEKLYPEYTNLALLETTITPFKTLIVDEAQDIMTFEYLDLLDAYVDQGLKSGRWRVFCDVNNQAAVFGVSVKDALDRLMGYGTSILLYTNCRNTASIAQETNLLTKPRLSSLAKIQGDSVQYNWYKNKEQQVQKLSKILKNFLSNDIAAARITILSPLSVESSCANNIKDIKLAHLTDGNITDFLQGTISCITYCSISAFKGLENDFIVLTDIEKLDPDWWDAVVYVGMSRAKTALYILLNESIRDIYNHRLESWMQEKLS